MGPIGLIINERSDRSASVLDDLLHVSGRFKSVRTAVLDGIRGLDTALVDMAQRGVETLIIGGGDGTLQAALTDSINNLRFDRAPRYVALPCGMTNVIANDCGLKGNPAESLDNFLWRHDRGKVEQVSRPLIALRHGDAPPIYGFFFGTAAFHSAVHHSRSKVQSKGMKRSAQMLISTASFIWKVARDRSAADHVKMTLEETSDHRQKGENTQLLFMATTLKSVGSGIFPFWGQGPGDMAVMSVHAPGEKLLRAAPHILRGRSRPWFEREGYFSWRENRMVTRFNAPYVFDGEIFQATRDVPTIFDTSVHAQFLN